MESVQQVLLSARVLKSFLHCFSREEDLFLRCGVLEAILFEIRVLCKKNFQKSEGYRHFLEIASFRR